MIDLAKCAQFAMDCLDPSQYGHAVTAEVRDAARRALGIAARECPQPSVPKPETDVHIPTLEDYGKNITGEAKSIYEQELKETRQYYANKHEGIGTSYDQVERTELDQRDK